jgi:predicted DNA-binding transcriptional regulator AlpA
MARDELITLNQLLAELGEGDQPLPKSTFFDWRAKGRAPRAIKLPNGALRFRRSEVERWLKSYEEAA